eukprot:m.11927 g.11927  ORF g.11927 m.11927 type:complete len:317 (-) comp4558_c0_seq1:322-1272(-)
MEKANVFNRFGISNDNFCRQSQQTVFEFLIDDNGSMNLRDAQELPPGSKIYSVYGEQRNTRWLETRERLLAFMMLLQFSSAPLIRIKFLHRSNCILLSPTAGPKKFLDHARKEIRSAFASPPQGTGIPSLKLQELLEEASKRPETLTTRILLLSSFNNSKHSKNVSVLVKTSPTTDFSTTRRPCRVYLGVLASSDNQTAELAVGNTITSCHPCTQSKKRMSQFVEDIPCHMYFVPAYKSSFRQFHGHPRLVIDHKMTKQYTYGEYLMDCLSSFIDGDAPTGGVLLNSHISDFKKTKCSFWKRKLLRLGRSSQTETG